MPVRPKGKNRGETGFRIEYRFKELRSRNPNLKMILVSGYAEDAFEKNLPEGGQFVFLAKPFTLKQLVATVKDAMAS